MPYVSREAVGALIRPNVLSGIFETKEAYSSIVMSLGEKIDVGTKETIIPISGTEPVAEFVEKTGTQATPTAGKYPAVAVKDAPDIGYKPVSTLTLGDKRLILEKIAVIIPLSDCTMEDMTDAATFEAYVRRKGEEAIGRRFDRAVVLGENPPSTFGSGLIPSAVTAGNVVPVAKTATAEQKLIALDDAFGMVEDNGYEVDAVAAQTRFRSIFRKAMNNSNVLVTPDMVTGRPSYSYMGVPITKATVLNGTNYLAVPGAWKNVKWGVRNEFEVTTTNTGIITNEDGSQYNLFQQDMTAIRIVLRVGYVVLADDDAYPIAVVQETEAAA